MGSCCTCNRTHDQRGKERSTLLLNPYTHIFHSASPIYNHEETSAEEPQLIRSSLPPRHLAELLWIPGQLSTTAAYARVDSDATDASSLIFSRLLTLIREERLLGELSLNVGILDSVWKPSTPAHSSTSFLITSKATTIEWKGYGLKIHISDNSLAPSLPLTTRTRLEVYAHTLANDVKWYQYLGGYIPVSGLYSIQMRTGKLCKPVTIEFQNCLGSLSDHDIDISDLAILRAADVTEHFEPIDDTVFDRGSGYGKITVPKLDGINQEYDDFSWFIVALRQFFLPNTIHYIAHVYTSKMKICFIVTMALELCTTVCWLTISLCQAGIQLCMSIIMNQ